MVKVDPRLRVFAGPNGSGKSTIKDVVEATVPGLQGVLINQGKMEKAVKQRAKETRWQHSMPSPPALAASNGQPLLARLARLAGVRNIYPGSVLLVIYIALYGPFCMPYFIYYTVFCCREILVTSAHSIDGD